LHSSNSDDVTHLGFHLRLFSIVLSTSDSITN